MEVQCLPKEFYSEGMQFFILLSCPWANFNHKMGLRHRKIPTGCENEMRSYDISTLVRKTFVSEGILDLRDVRPKRKQQLESWKYSSDVVMLRKTIANAMVAYEPVLIMEMNWPRDHFIFYRRTNENVFQSKFWFLVLFSLIFLNKRKIISHNQHRLQRKKKKLWARTYYGFILSSIKVGSHSLVFVSPLSKNKPLHICLD